MQTGPFRMQSTCTKCGGSGKTVKVGFFLSDTRRYHTRCCQYCKEFGMELSGDDVDSLQLRGWKLVG
jgi:DnaJ-class molecular chaperone